MDDSRADCGCPPALPGRSQTRTAESDTELRFGSAPFEIDERKTSLQNVLREVGEQMVYQYDLGDNWEHDVVLEEILVASESATKLPICLEGARHSPPE